MPTETKYIEQLIFKFNTGTITTEETQILIDWYNSHDDQNVTIPTTILESHDTIKSRMLANILSRVADEHPKPLKLYKRWRWVAAAAAAVIITFGVWMVHKNTITTVPAIAKTEITPGGNKATLTLPDGRTIALSDSQTGIIAGEEITYTNGTSVEQISLNPSDEIRSLTFHTPRGGTYSITLQDGTQVWLNAASTLKYPSRFNEDERLVEIEGEAYFKVKTIYAKNGKKIPFRVISNRQTIEVLGTEFNMNTYPEQATSKTTLVEGRVSIHDGKDHFVLSPNEQAVTTAGKTSVNQVNPSNYTAWRQGKFSFDGKTFVETMSEIGRWYDLEVVYQNGIPKAELAGDAFRNQNIRFVLRLLDVAEINYKLDVSQRKVFITGKK